MGLKPSPWDPSSFSAVTLFVGSFNLQKLVPDMTYNVFGGTLNLAQSSPSVRRGAVRLSCDFARLPLLDDYQSTCIGVAM